MKSTQVGCEKGVGAGCAPSESATAKYIFVSAYFREVRGLS